MGQPRKDNLISFESFQGIELTTQIYKDEKIGYYINWIFKGTKYVIYNEYEVVRQLPAGGVLKTYHQDINEAIKVFNEFPY